ncbi:hypothetical protein BJ875DRAFT_183245 [Amylocarpus encephaloides]|uniref:Uncharacterized protein n=1 Tax=Amylocarpus encephaloides TaxID=45428 RepID=A0A9P7YAV5_9HELO|nr:hypothetical protein BJ875DRAFT_183245 [Amylocarpus encephaloides]
MKTIPSLVASSTVGVAAAGLALGQPDRVTPLRPSSKKRALGELAEFGTPRHDTSSPTSRPGSMSTATTPENKLPQRTSGSSSNPPSTSTTRTQPQTSRSDLPPSTSRTRRISIFRYGEVASPVEPAEDTRRDSISSRGSWMRRLSTIPNSYNNSPRSSVGPDSPSLTFSHGSAAPILSEPTSSPAQLPPNKLVKRVPSVKEVSGSITRSRSKTQVPTLRRPATSHQRSITLQQQFKDDSPTENSQATPIRQSHISPASRSTTPDRPTFRPYFESRPTKFARERLSGKPNDGNLQDFHSMAKRIVIDGRVQPILLKPAVIRSNSSRYPVYVEEDDSLPLEDSTLVEMDEQGDAAIPSVEVEPAKRPRRSLSLHFSSPTAWLSRSGSMRGSRRTATRDGGKRYSSAPVSSLPGRNIMSAHGSGDAPRAIMDPTVFEQETLSPVETSSPHDPFDASVRKRGRNSSSPLPPLSRLSSFNLDLARLGLSSSSSSGPRHSPSTPIQHSTTATSLSSVTPASPSATMNFGSFPAKPARASDGRDRSSTLVGSDHEAKVVGSGEDDEMDFQSDTVYDSLRSGATGSTRSRNAALDSMFDESPPSLNGHPKNKRLSIHEILGNGSLSEGHSRIVEEDEGMSTPVKNPVVTQEDGFLTPVRPGTAESDFPSSPPSFCLATKDFSRLSLDDDEEDEDWTKDEENMEINNQLSPPSSSLNSRRVSASFRAALADVTRINGNSATSAERPKSNLFDWSEPSSAEKMDYMGNSPRPKTAHVKQMADGRGGRAIGRRGPGAMHIRSQSVPVVPDITGQRELSKLTPKFGTWGLGAKGVSEDWDNDFDFDNGGEDHDGDVPVEKSGMHIPPTIQASQASVVGHVGQIREVCLLVEDLKRLRLLAKEKGLLDGVSAPLWKEAEGIIALAVPDEEDLTLSPPHSPSSIDFDLDVSSEKTGNREGAGDAAGGHVSRQSADRLVRPTGYAYESKTVRRRSVFAPDDDIFGAGFPRDYLLPPPPSIERPSSIKSSSEIARTVMETMHQHRAISDPLLKEMSAQSANKMPFDTTSLRDLVHRANVLTRTLGDLIRKSDGRSPSPEANPHRDSSPAFTRVFTDPMASPPKQLPRSQSNNSMLSGSIDSSPTRPLGQRMHMMAVV